MIHVDTNPLHCPSQLEKTAFKKQKPSFTTVNKAPLPLLKFVNSFLAVSYWALLYHAIKITSPLSLVLKGVGAFAAILLICRSLKEGILHERNVVIRETAMKERKNLTCL